MKKLLIPTLAAAILFTSVTTPASALSCMAPDFYLNRVVTDAESIVFKATTKDTLTEKDYTAEVLTVDEAFKGYIEKTAMVYHRKDATWGYFCNQGPRGTGTTGIYVATQDDNGQYHVSQRLNLDDSYATSFLDQLKHSTSSKEVVAFNNETHQNDLLEVVMKLFRDITVLLKEKTYFATHR